MNFLLLIILFLQSLCEAEDSDAPSKGESMFVFWAFLSSRKWDILKDFHMKSLIFDILKGNSQFSALRINLWYNFTLFWFTEATRLGDSGCHFVSIFLLLSFFPLVISVFHKNKDCSYLLSHFSFSSFTPSHSVNKEI